MEKKRVCGKASAWKKDGIHVLHLRGTNNEMARQHGILLKEQIQNGALPYLGMKNEKLLAQSHLFKGRPRLTKFVQELIRITMHKPMLAQVPREYMDEARALAAAAEIPFKYCLEGMVHADMIVLMLRYFLGRHVLGQMAGGFPGCTSVVATGKATGGNGIIHARNMDYPVVGKWDTQPAVFYCDPEGADRGQRAIGITSAGIHTRGVTAVNESGITLSAHFHCAKAVSPFGTPIQFIGSEVTRKARTIGQAVDIVREYERAGTWSLVVSSAKENDAAVIEMIHGKVAVREPENGLLAHTNHFRTPEFQEKEVLLSVSVADDYCERYHRALDLLNEDHGKIDKLTAARILGDHFDRGTKKIRSQGNTISVVTTITSLISELHKGRFWVGNSCESPTGLGDYTRFDLHENFVGYDDREPETYSWHDDAKARGVQTATIAHTPKHSAYRVFRAAYQAYHTDFDPIRAADFAQKAAEMDPEEGHYHMAHGHFRMRLGQVDTALDAFRDASRCTMSAHMKQVAKLYSGHAFDCAGKREEAVAHYKQVLDAIDPHVRDEAKRCLSQPFHIDRAERMTFDLQFCDSFEYA